MQQNVIILSQDVIQHLTSKLTSFRKMPEITKSGHMKISEVYKHGFSKLDLFTHTHSFNDM